MHGGFNFPVRVSSKSLLLPPNSVSHFAKFFSNFYSIYSFYLFTFNISARKIIRFNRFFFSHFSPSLFHFLIVFREVFRFNLWKLCHWIPVSSIVYYHKVLILIRTIRDNEVEGKRVRIRETYSKWEWKE